MKLDPTMRDRASDLRAIADGRLMLNVRNGVTVSRSMLAMIADEFEAMSTALAAKDAELAKFDFEKHSLKVSLARVEANLAEARKALNRLTAWLSDEYDDVPNIVSVSLAFDNGEEIAAMPLGDFRAARRALTGGHEDG